MFFIVNLCVAMATNEEPVRSETPPPAYSTVVDLQRPPPSYNSLWVSSPTADYAQNIAQEEGKDML